MMRTGGWRGAGSQALGLLRWDFLRRASRIRRSDHHPRVQSDQVAGSDDALRV